MGTLLGVFALLLSCNLVAAFRDKSSSPLAALQKAAKVASLSGDLFQRLIAERQAQGADFNPPYLASGCEDMDPVICDSILSLGECNIQDFSLFDPTSTSHPWVMCPLSCDLCRVDHCAGVTCPASENQCIKAGMCDRDTGICSEASELPADTPCDDNNDKTENDRCKDGTCIADLIPVSPVATDDAFTIDEDSMGTFDVLANDIDFDGTIPDTLTVISAVSEKGGTVDISPDGKSVIYTPAANFNGIDLLSYTIQDVQVPRTVSSKAFVRVTLMPINDGPLCPPSDVEYIATEDTPIDFDIVSAATDADEDVLNFDVEVGITWPDQSVSHGSTASFRGGAISYSPGAEFHGDETIGFALVDGNGGTVGCTITIHTTAVNDAPVAVEDSLDMLQDGGWVSVSVLDNDSDVDGDTLSIVFVSPPGQGSSEIQGSTVRYTPKFQYTGTDSFSYTISDPDGATSTATISVNVANVNDDPIATTDAFTIEEDTPTVFSVLENDTDIDGDVLLLQSVGQGSHGGTTEILGTTTISYTPAKDFNGVEEFQYVVADENGGSAIGQITVTVTPMNDSPDASNDNVAVDEDDSVEIDVLSNDTDIDGDDISLDVFDHPSHGSVVQVSDTNKILYKPAHDFNGMDSFSYTISDTSGAQSKAFVYIKVDNVNDPPVYNDGAVKTYQSSESAEAGDFKTTMDVLADSTDVDVGEVLIVLLGHCDSGGSLELTDAGNAGPLLYASAPHFFGLESCTFSIADAHGGSTDGRVSIDVSPVNDAPVAAADDFTVEEDSLSNTLDVLANDSDVDNTQADLSIVSAQTDKSTGTVAVSNDGLSIQFTPATNFFTTGDQRALIFYTITDGLLEATAIASVAVTGVNDSPSAVPDEMSCYLNGPAVTSDVLSNDFDVDGDAISLVAITKPPQHGTATIVAAAEDPVLLEKAGKHHKARSRSFAWLTRSVIEYAPNLHYQGPDSFEYSIYDGVSSTPVTTEVNVTVLPADTIPFATDDAFTLAEDTIAAPMPLLRNDFDDDGSPLTLLTLSSPGHGTVAFSEDKKEALYTPTPDYCGSDSFSYTMSDGQPSHSVFATVSLTITCVDDAPTPGHQDAHVLEDDDWTTFAVVAEAASDIDNANDELRICSFGDSGTLDQYTTPAGNTVQLADGQRSIRYKPAANYNGVDEFDYLVCDPAGLSATMTVRITVTPAQDAPVATDDTVSMDEDTTAVITPLANDLDVDGDTILIQSVTQSKLGGTATLSDDKQSISFSPKPDFAGSDEISYTITDGTSFASAVITFTIKSVNDAPRVQNDALTTAEDDITVVDVLANDYDDENDPLQLVNVGGTSAFGIVKIVNNKVQYASARDYSGTETFTYEVSDGQLSSTGEVTVTVTDVNDAPVAGDDTYTVSEESGATSFTLLSNDSDVDGDALTITSVVPVSSSTSTVVISPDGSSVDYTPAKDFNGNEVFTYVISDSGGLKATAHFSVMVNNINDVPIAVADSALGTEALPLSIFVLGNDVDIDPNDKAVGIRFVQPAVSGKLDISVGRDGVAYVTYTANSGIWCGTDAFTYVAIDKQGAESAPATVDLELACVNNAPRAMPDEYSIQEDAAPTGFFVLNNDEDDDNDQLSLVSVSSPNAVISGQALIYTPVLDFNGEETFTYVCRDPSGLISTSTVKIVIAPVNDDPVTTADAFTVVQDSRGGVFAVLANDSDVDGDSLSVSSVDSSAMQGSLTTDGVTVTYVPKAGYNGIELGSYIATDSNGGSATGRIVFTVLKTSPAANDDIYNVLEDSSKVALDILSNDIDRDGRTILIKEVVITSKDGSAQVIRHGLNVLLDECTLNSGLMQLLRRDGEIDSLEYTPNKDFNGVDSFTYTIIDMNGKQGSAMVTINVLPVNDPPATSPDAYTINEDSTTSTWSVLANDADVDGDTITISKVTASTGATSVSIDETNTRIKYVPPADFCGTDALVYTATDGKGGSTDEHVNVTVNCVNDAPFALDDSYTLGEDSSSTTFSVLANDYEVDIGDTIHICRLILGSEVHGTAVIKSDTAITFTPGQQFNGLARFSYVACDSTNTESVPAYVTVSVNSVNDAPVANADAFTIDEDIPSDFAVLDNDSDIDHDALTITAVETGSKGGVTTINDDGVTVHFVPAANYYGQETFVYTVADASGATDTATVTLTIRPVNDAPIAVDDAYKMKEDTPRARLDVLQNDSDVDGDALSVAAVVTPAHGQVVISADQKAIEYTPNANFNGEDKIVYVVSDGFGGRASGIVVVNVDPLPDAPIVADDTYSVAQNVPETAFFVLSNDRDVDYGDASLRIVSLELPSARGTARISEDGRKILYAPQPNYHGDETMSYTVSDGSLSSTAKVTFHVLDVNDAPVPNPDDFTVDEDSKATILDVLANDSDKDMEGFYIASVGVPSNGGSISIENTLVERGLGQVIRTSLKYTPVANFNGVETFHYIVADNRGGTATGDVTVHVAPVPDAPIAVDDEFTIAEDGGSITLTVMANDVDVDGPTDVLTITKFAVLSGSEIVVLGANVLVYTPSPDFSGDLELVYTISDSTGLTDSARVIVHVTPVNDAPVATDDVFKIACGAAATPFRVLNNDSDVDGDALVIAGVHSNHGSDPIIKVSDDKLRIIYQRIDCVPGESITATYTVSDGKSISQATATFVSSDAEGPIVNDDSFRLVEDGIVATLDVLADDTVVDDVLTIASVSSTRSGAVAIKTGLLEYTPLADWCGEDRFTYQAANSAGTRARGNVVVSVACVNDAPIAVPDQFEVAENSDYVPLDVLLNDVDVDSAKLAIISCEDPHRISIIAKVVEGQMYTPSAAPDLDVDSHGHGSVTVDNGNMVMYKPFPGFSGSETFICTISDGSGGLARGSVTVTVPNKNDNPVAVDDFFTVAANSGSCKFSVLVNDYDADYLDVIAIESVRFISGNGLLIIDDDGQTLTFRPSPNFVATAAAMYKIVDGNGGTSTGTVSFNVIDTVDPVPNADVYALYEDCPSTELFVLDNDSDLDGGVIRIASVSTASQGGSVTVDASGRSLHYKPVAHFNGQEVFTYQILGSAAPVAVTVLLAPRNHDPDAMGDSYDVREDSLPSAFSVLDNDVDIDVTDGDDLHICDMGVPNSGGHAEIVADSNGNSYILYTPAANFNGVEKFWYMTCDNEGGSDTATVTVAVSNVNDAPVASDDSYRVAKGAGLATFSVLDNDFDADISDVPLLVITSVKPGSGMQGTFSISSDKRAITFAPPPGFAGRTAATYTVADPMGSSSSASVAFVVTEAVEEAAAPPALVATASKKAPHKTNAAPVAATHLFTVTEDCGDVLLELNDEDPDQDILIILGVSSANNGGVVSIRGDYIKYAPALNFHGTETFSYIVGDSFGIHTTMHVNVEVVPVNDAPVANADSYVACKNSKPILLHVLANDVDVDGDALSLIRWMPLGPDSSGSAVSTPFMGSLRLATTAKGEAVFSYQPLANFVGSERFAYTATDADGLTSSTEVRIQVSNDEDMPRANDDYFTINMGAGTQALSVLDSDSTVSFLKITEVSQALHGTVAVVGSAIAYTAPDLFAGTDTFTYSVVDSDGGASEARVFITIRGTNRGPTANADQYSLAAGDAGEFHVLENDFDADAPNVASLTISAVGAPAHGTVVISDDGQYVTYQPESGFAGTDTFQYTCVDLILAPAAATVTVVVRAPDQGSAANDDFLSVPANSGRNTLDVLANDEDGLTISQVPRTASLGSYVKVAPDSKSVYYAPQPGLVDQTETFTYTVIDALGTQSTATVQVKITATLAPRPQPKGNAGLGGFVEPEYRLSLLPTPAKPLPALKIGNEPTFVHDLPVNSAETLDSGNDDV